MWKTFLVSPLIGAVAAALGWLSALLMRDAMSDITFESIPAGWPGLLIGSIAAATLLLVLLSGRSIDPLVTTAVAGAGVALLWNQRDLPFSTQNLEQGTNATYWFTVTMMLVVLVLLILGLRVARDSSTRSR